jgi:hypothetical protein
MGIAKVLGMLWQVRKRKSWTTSYIVERERSVSGSIVLKEELER